MRKRPSFVMVGVDAAHYGSLAELRKTLRGMGAASHQRRVALAAYKRERATLVKNDRIAKRGR